MKIKKFAAGSFRDALNRVKKELGQEAVILSSEEIGGLNPMVEVVAAIDRDVERDEMLKGYALDREVKAEKGGGAHSKSGAWYSGTAADRTNPGPDYHDQVLSELRRLRENLEDLRNKGYEVALPEDKKRMVQFLRNRFIREDLALQLVEKASGLSELSRIIREKLQTGWDWSGKKVIMLIGSTGVGKTTTAAKLCGQAIKQKRKVGLISLDTFRIGAIEQIRIYSRILGVPLCIASSPEEVREGIQKLQDRDIILIDTTGRNPKDQSYRRELKAVYSLGIPIETHLLVSGSSSEQFMAASLHHYQDLTIDRIAFTKMDEAEVFGPVYNFSRQAGKPIAYLTTGQKVPNDIAFFSGDQLADLILNSQGLERAGANEFSH
jgi:flagellar biosynthesis protein FlhF